jgi:hypothetical protein
VGCEKEGKKREVRRQRSRILHATKECPRLTEETRRTYLELSHQRPYLLLQSLIRDLAPSQVDLVPNQDNRHINSLSPEEG